jgi:hypothetical protein
MFRMAFAFSLCASPCLAQTTYQTYGNTTYGSDGSMAQTFGNQTFITPPPQPAMRDYGAMPNYGATPGAPKVCQTFGNVTYCN